jgi:dolichol-phosphate mannosyltransferase
MTESQLKILEISIVIPVHNESENILPLIAETEQILNDLIFHEVICVDDGSTDDTLMKLIGGAKQFNNVRILHHQQCCGQSAALKSGVNAAKGAWIVTMDGDGQNDPASIVDLLAARKAAEGKVNLRMVCGWRKERLDPWNKRISSRIANKIRGSLLKDKTPDTGCGLKLISKTAFQELPFFDHMHRFLPALIIRNGGEVLSIPVKHRPREKGQTHYGVSNRLWTGILDMLGVMWLQRRARNPETQEISV